MSSPRIPAWEIRGFAPNDPWPISNWQCFKLNTFTNIRDFLYQEKGKTGQYFLCINKNYSIGDFSELSLTIKQFKHLQGQFFCSKKLKKRVFSKKSIDFIAFIAYTA